MVAEAEQWRFRVRSDNDATGTDIMTVDRTGTTVDTITIGANAQININQAQYVDLDTTSSTVGIRLRTADTQRGYLYADVNGIGILNDAGGWSIRHNHSNDSVTIIGELYPNGQTTGHIQAVSGYYGSIEVDCADGSSGTWNGYSVGGRLVLMDLAGDATTNRGGLYDDLNNQWIFQYNQGAAGADDLTIYNGGSEKFRTTTTGIDITGGITLDTDITWAQASQPWVTLDSTSSGDGWSAQGAGISVGESGKKGSAAIHMTYNGGGYGYLGMGTVDDTAGTGGRPAFGHFNFTYNNYNVQVGGRLFPGTNSNTVQSTKYIEATTGYGSINVAGGGTSSYAGYSINNDIAFMSNGTTHGIYNAGAGEWILSTTDNSHVYLYYDGTTALRTANGNTDGLSTWGQVKHNNGTFYDIGMNVMPRFVTNASVTLAHQHAGGWMYHSNTTTYTITLNNTAAQGASFPIDGTFFVMNYSTGVVTVNTGTGTLYSPQLGTSTTGSRTIGGNSVATILKYSADNWFIWGDNIS
jgi:hypothetical protein